MRHLRPILAFLVISAFLVACSSPGGGSSGPSSEASSGASQPDASQATASSDGGGGGAGGGGLNGSITYQISGDYTASGELPFFPTGVSNFGSGGWAAWFGEQGGDTVIQLNTNPDASIANFGNTEVAIVGIKDTGCTFNFTKNDASGLAGSVECRGIQAVKSQASSLIHVDFTATWDAHP